MQKFFDDWIDWLRKSKKPLILVGRGISASGSRRLFEEFINMYQIPVVTSLLGLDCLPYDHKYRIGFIGTYGNRWANYALGSCDLLLVLGSRLDSRQTGDRISFQKDKLIYHVDIDEYELNNNISGCITLRENLYDFFLYALGRKEYYIPPLKWIEDIKCKKITTLDTEEFNNACGINPNDFIHRLFKSSDKARAFTVDVGNNQMWTAQSLELKQGQLLLTSGGMGAMGYALPAAIGACMALNHAPVVCISGDGGFQINIQELETISTNCLPIKIVVLNNQSLGMVRQFQDEYFENRHQSTINGYSSPIFTDIAKAYHIEAMSADVGNVNAALEFLWAIPNEPSLLDVNIDITTNAYPKISWGKSLLEMKP